MADSSDVLVLQLMRFASSPDKTCTIKSNVHVNLEKTISLPICERSDVVEVNLLRHYHVRASINHTGTRDKGHYTAYINAKNKWFKYINPQQI